MYKKFTMRNLKALNNKAIVNKDSLLQSVCEHFIDKIVDYDDPKVAVEELLEYGCQSGVVSELIYYSDTTAYYEANKEAINELLYNTLDECGFKAPQELFGDKWDDEDPLAIYNCNQNLLAWFAFEETTRRMAGEFEDLEGLV